MKNLAAVFLILILASCQTTGDKNTATTGAAQNRTLAIMEVPRDFLATYGFCPVELLNDPVRAREECQVHKMIDILFGSETGFFSPIFNNNYFKDEFLTPVFGQPDGLRIILSGSNPDSAFLVWAAEPGKHVVTSAIHKKMVVVFGNILPVHNFLPEKVNYLGSYTDRALVLLRGEFAPERVRNELRALGEDELAANFSAVQPTVITAACEDNSGFWSLEIDCTYTPRDSRYPKLKYQP